VLFRSGAVVPLTTGFVDLDVAGERGVEDVAVSHGCGGWVLAALASVGLVSFLQEAPHNVYNQSSSALCMSHS
jgi:hypothetical protein